MDATCWDGPPKTREGNHDEQVQPQHGLPKTSPQGADTMSPARLGRSTPLTLVTTSKAESWGPGGFYDPRVGTNEGNPTPQSLYNYTALKNTPAQDWFGQPINNTLSSVRRTSADADCDAGHASGESTLQVCPADGPEPEQSLRLLGLAGNRAILVEADEPHFIPRALL